MSNKTYTYTFYRNGEMLEINYKKSNNEGVLNYILVTFQNGIYNYRDVDFSNFPNFKFNYHEIPILSNLSEEELFQQVVAWDNELDPYDIKKIQEKLTPEFIEDIKNIMDLKCISFLYRGLISITGDD